MMAEGISLRSITRLTDISRTTLIKLLEDAGEAFSTYQDKALVNLPCRRIQVDEAWAFCYAKQKNVATAKAAPAAIHRLAEGAGKILKRPVSASELLGDANQQGLSSAIRATSRRRN